MRIWKLIIFGLKVKSAYSVRNVLELFIILEGNGFMSKNFTALSLN